MKRGGIGLCACCAVRMVYVVLTQRRSEEGRERTMCMLCCTYGVCCVDTEKVLLRDVFSCTSRDYPFLYTPLVNVISH